MVPPTRSIAALTSLPTSWWVSIGVLCFQSFFQSLHPTVVIVVLDPDPRNLGSYSNRGGCAGVSSFSFFSFFSPGSRLLLKPTPTRRKRCCGPSSTRSRSDKAMLVNSSQEDGGDPGVWLRVTMLNSL